MTLLFNSSALSTNELSGLQPLNSSGLTLLAPYSETTDAPSSTSTPYTISPGDTFNGTISSFGDTDWVRIDLVAGQTYVIDLYGTGGSVGLDTYLRVYDDSGFLQGDNDDEDLIGGDRSSQMVFSVAETGTYYIEADTWNSQFTGTYQIAVSSGSTTTTPVYTPQQIADYLRVGFWQDVGESARSFAVSYGGTLDVDISGLTAPVQQLALWALDAWSTASGIIFNTTLAGGVIADIAIDDQFADAYTTFPSISGSTIIQASVNVGTNWTDFYGTNFDSYSLLTFIHEIGHALGLGHAGYYNASASYGTDNHYLNDSWQATVMSYFDQLDNSYVTASFAFSVTPMIADIIAIQAMYGVDPNLRSGNTIYGENSNAGGTYAIVSQMIAADTLVNPITMTIADQGGVDLLDLRSDTADQRIDLASGTVSDVYGGVGNLSIAVGTVLENVLAGAGNDTVTGNSANNTLTGNVGSDVLFGMDGNDSLMGNGGFDLLNGGAGNDTLDGGGASDTLEGGADDDTLFGRVGTDFLYGDSGNDSLDGGGGVDELYGGIGFDTLRGGNGFDTLMGEADDDWLFGAAGNDSVDGGDGNDRAFGGGHVDTLTGGLGNDSLNGDGGADLIQGDAGMDRLLGGVGADTILGGADDDRIFGGGDADRIVGGTGDDISNGGTGADEFVFATGDGFDRIMDFEDGIDLIRITAGAVDFGGVTVTAQGLNTLVTFSDVSVLIRTVDSSLIDASDFVFG